MFKIPAKKVFIFLLILFEMIIAILTLKICGENNFIKCFGVIALITLIFDCALMNYMNIRLYSPASVFIILSYIFSFGQFIVESFFPSYEFRYEDIVHYNRDDVYNSGIFCFVIIQLIFIGLLLQRSIIRRDLEEEKKEDNYVDYKHIRALGFIITIICLPIWLFYNIQTYTLSQIKGGYVVGANQVNGIVEKSAKDYTFFRIRIITDINVDRQPIICSWSYLRFVLLL